MLGRSGTGTSTNEHYFYSSSKTLRAAMGCPLHSTGCVKRPKECWNESHAICAPPCGAKTKEKPAGVNRRPLETPPAHTPHHMPGRESLWQSSEDPYFLRGLGKTAGQWSALLICDHESLRNLWPTALDGLSQKFTRR